MRQAGGISGGRQALPTGSHHQPFSHSGGGGTTGGRQTLATGSHHAPPSHCAELIAGAATVTAPNAASGANATPTPVASRRTMFVISNLPERSPLSSLAAAASSAAGAMT